MAANQHPYHAVWNDALERLVDVERRYHIALMEERTVEEIQIAARDLDEARERYRVAAEKIEQDGSLPPAGVSLMITAAQREQLRELGYNDAEIADMTPAEAHAILEVQ